MDGRVRRWARRSGAGRARAVLAVTAGGGRAEAHGSGETNGGGYVSGRIVGKIGGAVETARRRVCERHMQNAEAGRCCRQRTDNARLTLACDGLDAANARVLVCNHLEMAQVWYKSRASLAQVWCKVVGKFRQVKRRTRLEQRLTNRRVLDGRLTDRRRELTRGKKNCRPFPFLCGRLHHGGNVPRQGETSFFLMAARKDGKSGRGKGPGRAQSMRCRRGIQPKRTELSGRRRRRTGRRRKWTGPFRR